jgi:hypothetical protein
MAAKGRGVCDIKNGWPRKASPTEASSQQAHSSRAERIVQKAGQKAKRPAHRSGPPVLNFCEVKLEGLYVRGLQALGALGDFEFNRLAIIQRLIAISHDRGEMDENVLTALALDETEALAGIEPLHCSLFFTHCCTRFCQLGYS